MSEQETRQSTPDSSKRPYAKPQLVEYGPVEKLTHSGTQALGDGGPMMMPCL